MQEKILHMLREAPGDFVSGEAMCQVCGVSRTAIWKHIKDLQDSGYEIEAVRNKGYRLLSTPDLVTPSEIRNGLQTKSLGSHIVYREEIDSTNDHAQRLAGEGIPDGTLVVAEVQTKGRGRRGRKWFSPPKSGVWMSMVLRPQRPIGQIAQITLVAAIALSRAFTKLTGVQAGIKWPNDILFDGKKCCGILTEMHVEADMVAHLVLGIGINVNIPQADFPEEISSIATSLQAVKGAPLKRAEVIRTVWEEFEPLYMEYIQGGGFGALREHWIAANITLGRDIVTQTAQGLLRGKALDIDENGVLLVKREDGELEKIYSADILLA